MNKISEFINAAYPPDKRRTELLFPGFLPIRVIAISITPIFLAIRLTPNTISTVSIMFLFGSAYGFVVGDQTLGAVALVASLVFDAADGQVARINQSSSAWGMQLERIQADLSYFLLLPSVAIGLVEEGAAEPILAFLAFAGTGSYVLFRHFYKRGVNLSPEEANYFLRIAIAQLKPHNNYRQRSAIGNFLYLTQRNAFSQLGLLYPTLVIISVFGVDHLPLLVRVGSLGYLAVGGFTMLGVIALGSKFYEHGSYGK